MKQKVVSGADQGQHPAFKNGAPAIAVLSEALPRGDGTWIVRPVVTNQQPMVTTMQAAKILNVDRQCVLWLYDMGYISGERPTPRKFMFTLESVLAHQKRSREPDFWDKNPWLEPKRKRGSGK